jgi:phenolic acid decarboxylase
MKIKKENADKIIYSFDEKKELLFEYCNRYNKTPIRNDVYKNVKMGQWLADQKQKCNAHTDEIYTVLSTNPIVKDALDKYIEKNK